MRILTEQEKAVIENKGTERPYSGEYEDFWEPGTYLCKRCDAPLYKSVDKFNAQCGWPSFDDEIEGAVNRTTDADGSRTEITCKNCGAHLGHVFTGESFTDKNTRHCVNSISLVFVPDNNETPKTDSIYFGGGCFWCVEAVFGNIPGVIQTTCGYAGGSVKDPTYEQVCSGTTGHAEVVQIDYDPKIVNLNRLLELFFQSHDPTTPNRQGNDIGSQYRSMILYTDDQTRAVIETHVDQLKLKETYKDPIVTEVVKLDKFYRAEEYHQKYFQKNPNNSYCRIVIKPKLETLKLT